MNIDKPSGPTIVEAGRWLGTGREYLHLRHGINNTIPHHPRDHDSQPSSYIVKSRTGDKFSTCHPESAKSPMLHLHHSRPSALHDHPRKAMQRLRRNPPSRTSPRSPRSSHPRSSQSHRRSKKQLQNPNRSQRPRQMTPALPRNPAPANPNQHLQPRSQTKPPTQYHRPITRLCQSPQISSRTPFNAIPMAYLPTHQP
jgi:hypothetical protein